MIAELAALAALYRSHMTCVSHEGRTTQTFYSDTMPTPDGRLLVQRNYASDFSEVITIAYDARKRRYVRAQAVADGSVATGTANAPVNGVWTWRTASVPPSAGEPRTFHFGIVSGKLRYWYPDGTYSVCE